LSGRGLTSGETTLVAAVFGETLDPAPVRLWRRRWWPLQPRHIVMAPDGHLWFPPGNSGWCEDFSQTTPRSQAFFLHEMTHVWQTQTGMNLILMRGPFARYAYLPLKPGKPFEAYGIEQQADIVRDYWLLRHGLAVPEAPPLSRYETLLPFLPPTI
jgi:hypothetical protein